MYSISRNFSLAIALAISLLSGCASTGGLITSLEDLSTESHKEGWIKVPQYRVASIPGWLPFPDVGGLYFYKAKRKPSTAIGLSPGKSFELISEIKSECDLPCLEQIRNDVVSLGKYGQAVVQTRVELSTFEGRKRAKDPDAPDQVTIDKATTAYKTAHDAFEATYEKVVNSIKKSGVLIYRWSTEATQSESLGLGSIASLKNEQGQKYNGFALVSGIRTKVLFVGNDLKQAWPALDKESRFANRFEVSTYVMQAKHIMYGNVADLSSYTQAKLNASYQQLSNIPDTLKALSEIEISMTLAKIANLSNIGVMGTMKRKTEEIDWTQTGLMKRFQDDEWLTFYSVESDFTDLRALIDHAR